MRRLDSGELLDRMLSGALGHLYLCQTESRFRVD